MNILMKLILWENILNSYIILITLSFCIKTIILKGTYEEREKM